jgi:hypothetical protein
MAFSSAAFANALGKAPLGPIIIETGPRVHVQGPGGKRVPVKTKRGREIGERDDPFFGIASKGRRGARARMRAMEEGRIALARRKASKLPPRSNPFLKDARRKAYVAAVKDIVSILDRNGINRSPDWVRREARKAVRRVAA